jgi:hypothetical protein
MPRNMVPLNDWFRWFRRGPRAIASSSVEAADRLGVPGRSLNFSGLFRILRIIQNCLKGLRCARIEEVTCEGYNAPKVGRPGEAFEGSQRLPRSHLVHPSKTDRQ